MHTPTTPLRVDIQALRGLAVLAVVLYHAKLGAIAGGYLGVDIFFVLSGFLITSVIRKAVIDGSFSYRSFLLRRARRLLPAAFVTLFVTALCAPFVLGAQELHDFWRQLLGALTFSANFVLTSQSDYFSGAAELKPLLHMWSLAVEEQYYFVLPALFLFLPKRAWLPSLVVLALASFALCYANQREASTFFLLPARAWEMLIGSVGVFLVDVRWVEGVARKLVFVTLAGLLLCLVYATSWFHPGPQALLVCLGTLGIILARHPALQGGVVIGGLKQIGDISYSLYLVHWPLFAFYNNIFFGDEHTPVQYAIRTGLVGLSFALAWCLNRYVEEPFRHAGVRWSRRPALAIAVAALLAVGVAQAIAPQAGNAQSYAHASRPNTGFAPECANSTSYAPLAQCQNSSTPTVLVWGDSYAMHLVPGLAHADLYPERLVQATRGRCGPLLGIASIQFNSEQWARECIRFNDAVLAYLASKPEIRTVILSSPLTPYKNGKLVLERVSPDGTPVLTKGVPTMSMAGLGRSVEAIRALGRHVILVAPPPTASFDVGRCLERRERGLWVGGVDAQCRIRVATYRADNAPVLAFLNAAESKLQLPIARFDGILCDAQFCRTRQGAVALYRDEGHLSHDGSKAVFALPAMQLEIRRAVGQSMALSQAILPERQGQ